MNCSWTQLGESSRAVDVSFKSCLSERADTEKKLKKCTGMVEIRKLCVSDEKVREEWIKSLQPMAEVLNERTTRVALKGKNFEVRNPASDQDIVITEDSVIAKADKTIVKGKYRAKDLSSCKEFHTFLKSHCRLRTYTFQI